MKLSELLEDYYIESDIMNEDTTHKTDHAGVSYNKRDKLWCANLLVNGKKISKYFKLESDAIAYRKQLEEKYADEIKKGKEALKNKYDKERNELIGKRFGRLIVLNTFSREKDGRTHGYATCRCDCGKEHTTNISRLKDGKCTSCGCLQQELKSDNADKMVNSKVSKVKRNATVLKSMKPRPENDSGVRGVVLNRKTGSWIGQLSVNGKHYSRSFPTKEQAISYRKELVDEYHKPKIEQLGSKLIKMLELEDEKDEKSSDQD